MKSTNKRTLTILGGALAAMTLLVGTAAVAGPFGGLGGDKKPAMVKRYMDLHLEDTLDELDATDQQRLATQALFDELFAEGVKMHQEKKAAKDDLRAILESDRPNPKALHALVDAKTAEMNAFGHRLADAALELHEVLTPAQRTQLIERLESRKGHHGPWGR